MTTPSLGLTPDNIDSRDVIVNSIPSTPLPADVDLRSHVVEVYEQGLHDCVVHPVVAAFQMLQRKTGQAVWTPSRRFLYYNTRKLLNSVIMDNGGNLRTALKAVKKWGLPAEALYPYDLNLSWRPHWISAPPPEVYAAAELPCSIKYAAVRANIKVMKSLLLQGYPIMFAFVVPQNFLDSKIAKTGLFSWNKKMKPSVNHAALLVALSDSRQAGIALNSFGINWGQQGYFEVPYKYLLSSKCYNFWVLQEGN